MGGAGGTGTCPSIPSKHHQLARLLQALLDGGGRERGLHKHQLVGYVHKDATYPCEEDNSLDEGSRDLRLLPGKFKAPLTASSQEVQLICTANSIYTREGLCQMESGTLCAGYKAHLGEHRSLDSHGRMCNASASRTKEKQLNNVQETHHQSAGLWYSTDTKESHWTLAATPTLLPHVGL